MTADVNVGNAKEEEEEEDGFFGWGADDGVRRARIDPDDL
jgi:hypothetical protein